MLQFVTGQSTNPYFNLAMEKWLCDHLDQQIILYLWQNENTVVIGKNQNPLRECRLDVLHSNGGHLARRCSGGGAVYHDLGNLNFTILVPNSQFNLEKQLDVIIRALRHFKIDAQFSGRNDLLVDGRKFSGNAFYHGEKNSFHHGTLLFNTDSNKINQILSVSKDKLKGNGVNSVEKRVMNLIECCPTLTLSKLSQQLQVAMQEVYEQQASEYCFLPSNLEEIQRFSEVYQSDAWLFPPQFHVDFSTEEKFVWGEVQLQLEIKKNQIKQVLICSDAMDEKWIHQLTLAWVDCKFNKQALLKASLPWVQSDLQRQMVDDILSCFDK